MIGVPLPNPRDQLIDNLNQQLDAFFGAGNKVKQVDPGATGVRDAMFGTSHAARLRAERDKLAPQLKALADKGLTVIEAAKEMGMETKRARLIARENSINFPGPQ
ncbi:hypothetical protein [Pseudomonas sp. VE 196-7]|uniref:hypothetical protein n=1 Tax=Pseudomonas sp. VE 196-7 TaxID=2956726 RepID=UPI0021D4CAED|nr:hypothetical protein [Pseudomonas sp. VE 196-7]MCU7217565.1 hypothetical protein [Pseudomonas sp. VE 196-7]